MSDELGKAAQAKVCFHQQPPAPARLSRKQPAQLDPHVQQKERERDQQESVSRVISSRPTAQLTRTTVARFDPESATILLSDRFGRHLAIDENEDQPLHFLLFTAGSFRGRQASRNRHANFRCAVLGTTEGVFSHIAVLSHTQSTHATRFASDGTSNDGFRPAAFQILNDIDTRKASVEVERLSPYVQGFQAFEQKLQNPFVIVFRSNELES